MTEAELYRKAVELPNAMPSKDQLIHVKCYVCGFTWLATIEDFVEGKCPICQSPKTITEDHL